MPLINAVYAPDGKQKRRGSNPSPFASACIYFSAIAAFAFSAIASAVRSNSFSRAAAGPE